MNQQEQMAKAREKIEVILQFACQTGWDEFARTGIWKNGMLSYDDVANQILLLPFIAVVDESQEFPRCLDGNRPRAKAFRDMRNNHWQKTLPKE